jgi:hypothetical protein
VGPLRRPPSPADEAPPPDEPPLDEMPLLPLDPPPELEPPLGPAPECGVDTDPPSPPGRAWACPRAEIGTVSNHTGTATASATAHADKSRFMAENLIHKGNSKRPASRVAQVSA